MSMTGDHDVVIVGAGVAGALVAHRLALRGMKTLVIEAGPRLDAATVFRDFTTSHDPYGSSCYPSLDYAPRPMSAYPNAYHHNTGPATYNTDYVRAVGGTTWHWGGVALRLSERDMRVRSLYGIGRDWPVAYSELEPYYGAAERELGVAGDDGEDFGAPRSQPYPMPPMPASYLDTEIARTFGAHGIRFLQLPQARNSEPYDGRPACAGNNTCNPVCPIQAKYSGDVHVRKAEAAGAAILAESQVTRLVADNTGRITAADLRHSDGTASTVRGKTFVLAANSIETPKVLLASASERYPGGLANRSDQVGRNLMGHTDRLLQLEWREPLFPGTGPQTNSCSTTFRDGPWRTERAGAFVIVVNYVNLGGIAGELLGQGVMGAELDRTIRHRALRRFDLLCFSEELPDPKNRITLDPEVRDSSGQPRINVHFSAGDYSVRGVEFAAKRIAEVGRDTGAFEIFAERHDAGSVHITGTTVMGKDPATSVVDTSGRCHDHPNLYLAGGGVFPSSGTVNPTLTIAALSLRTADTIAQGFFR